MESINKNIVQKKFNIKILYLLTLRIKKYLLNL